ncbi:MAG TPA: permease prefix domain 1-containing protein [Gemmatimonadales bacterium]|nr:permease prefix domain 1-containing protein [Gemmatimonadales bacterium]
MSAQHESGSLETQIDQWREFLRRRQAIHTVDVAELEDHLREQVSALVAGGLAPDEAFLVAVKRMGELDALSREFAREHSDRLWKQLVMVNDAGETRAPGRADAIMAVCLAVAAAIVVKLATVFIDLDQDGGRFARNLSLFVLPILTGYFAWKRKLASSTLRWIAAAFIAAAFFANIYPFTPEGSTEVLSVLHLPIALWLAVGIAYAGGRWNQVSGRMDFIRFSGELFIYYVLIALGGGVLTGFMAMIFQAIGMDVEPFFESWLLPCGAAGAVLIASWLVEAKQSVIENMAPVLTRLFTPLFAALLITFLVTLLVTGRGIDVERDALIAFDLLLAVVLALMLYSVSARDPLQPPGAFDVLQVVLVVSALLANAFALWAIAARITEFGFTPNRVAALGENVLLLVNLAWSAVLYTRFLRGRGAFQDLERWQTSYLPIFAGWAAAVVILFPPIFRYM